MTDTKSPNGVIPVHFCGAQHFGFRIGGKVQAMLFSRQAHANEHLLLLLAYRSSGKCPDVVPNPTHFDAGVR